MNTIISLVVHNPGISVQELAMLGGLDDEDVKAIIGAWLSMASCRRTTTIHIVPAAGKKLTTCARLSTVMPGFTY